MKRLYWLLLVMTILSASGCSQVASDSSAVDSPSMEASSPDQESATTAPSEQTQSDSSGQTSAPGNYITLQEFDSAQDKYEDSAVVLFFNANWCSTCKVARDNIESNLDSIPSDLTIVVVDFDQETELKKKYGVTIQHTFVQIDASGKVLAKWSGSVSAKEIAEKTI
jgi:thiol-disulfide isomerase/thioredoxin